MTLRIPAAHLERFSMVLSLPDEQRAWLLAELGSTELAVYPNKLVRRISSELGVARKEAMEFLGVVNSLFRSLDDLGLEKDQLIEEFTGALEDSEYAPAPEGPASYAKTDVLDFLSRLLDMTHSLAVMLKAAGVLSEHPHPVSHFRMLTDVRPVFSAGVEPVPVAGVVIHSFRISSYARDEDFFFALDRSDLLALKRVIDRALDKEERISMNLDSAGIQYLAALDGE